MATDAITNWRKSASCSGIRARWISRRSSRVWLLTAAIVLMSVADLLITLTYLRSSGMFEGNPVARWVISHGSSGLLVVWKLGSVLLACAVFAKFRRRWSTELACWGCCLVLVWLLVQWKAYADESDRILSTLQKIGYEIDANQFVRMDE